MTGLTVQGARGSPLARRPEDPMFKGLQELLQHPAKPKALLGAMEGHLARSGNFRFLDSPTQEIYPFGTPLLLSERQHEDLARWTRRIVQALETLGDRLRRAPSQARGRLLFPSPLEEEFFVLDPGMGAALPIHRLDVALAPQGPLRCLEVNCGCPGGELDPALVAEAFLAVLANQGGETAAWVQDDPALSFSFQDPRGESLDILLRCYDRFRVRRAGLPLRPTIALVTSSGQERFMIPECRGIAAFYQTMGFRTVVGDLLELEATDDGIVLRGEVIHLVFRKFSTLSFRRRMTDTDAFGEEACQRVRRVWEVVKGGDLCMVNPPGSTLLQDKGLLELLREEFPDLSPVIPETRVLHADFPARDPALWKSISRGLDFVLKKRQSFSGRHVILDPAEIRLRAPRLLEKEPAQWVAQERVPLPVGPFALWDRGKVRVGQFPFIVSPFGRSCFVRAGDVGPNVPLNAHQGGATTCAFVIPEDRPRERELVPS